MPLSNLISLFKTKQHPFIGKRVKCIEMKDEPQPVPSGTIGKVYNVGYDVMNVKWENGRNIGLIIDVDRYEFVD